MMNHMYDQSELTKHLSYFGTIDGPEVSYVAVRDHPSDIILLDEEILYNQIWSDWDYEQVLLWNSSPAGNASPSGIPKQPEEQHQCPGCSSPPLRTPPVELLQLPQGVSSSGPLSAQEQQPQPGTSGQAAIPNGPHPKPEPETSGQIMTQPDVGINAFIPEYRRLWEATQCRWKNYKMKKMIKTLTYFSDL